MAFLNGLGAFAQGFGQGYLGAQQIRRQRQEDAQREQYNRARLEEQDRRIDEINAYRRDSEALNRIDAQIGALREAGGYDQARAMLGMRNDLALRLGVAEQPPQSIDPTNAEMLDWMTAYKSRTNALPDQIWTAGVLRFGQDNMQRMFAHLAPEAPPAVEPPPVQAPQVAQMGGLPVQQAIENATAPPQFLGPAFNPMGVPPQTPPAPPHPNIADMMPEQFKDFFREELTPVQKNLAISKIVPSARELIEMGATAEELAPFNAYVSGIGGPQDFFRPVQARSDYLDAVVQGKIADADYKRVLTQMKPEELKLQAQRLQIMADNYANQDEARRAQVALGYVRDETARRGQDISASLGQARLSQSQSQFEDRQAQQEAQFQQRQAKPIYDSYLGKFVTPPAPKKVGTTKTGARKAETDTQFLHRVMNQPGVAAFVNEGKRQKRSIAEIAKYVRSKGIR